MTRGEKAEALFLEGYNCPQSVVLAFADKLPMDAETAARLVSAFGGGMSRMREVCGAASGMLFVLGALEGYANPADTDGKTALYTHGQALIRAFAETNGKGSFICADILASPGCRNRRCRKRGPKAIKRPGPAERSCGRRPMC